MSARYPVPPFGKLLQERLSDGARPPVCVHTGSMGWQRAKAWIESGDECFSHLLMPLDAAPADFDWSLCTGCEVAILHCPLDDFVPWETLDKLAVVIVKAGAIKVSLLDYLFQIRTFVPMGAAA